MAYPVCPNQVSDEMSTPIAAVSQVGDAGMLCDFVESEKNKWINQLVAKFRILYTSLVDFQSNHLPSLLLLLNPESLDQQSIVNQIQVSILHYSILYNYILNTQILMDEQRIEMKSFELMLGHLGVGSELLYPSIEMIAWEGSSSATATSTYPSRNVHVYHGDGYEHTVNFDGAFSTSATFLPPQVMSSGNFFPDSYSQLMSSGYCCNDGTANDQDLGISDNFDGEKGKLSSASVQ